MKCNAACAGFTWILLIYDIFCFTTLFLYWTFTVWLSIIATNGLLNFLKLSCRLLMGVSNDCIDET